MMLLGLAAAAICVAGPAAAQEQRAFLYNKFEFSPSVTSVLLNSDIRIDSENGNTLRDEISKHISIIRGGFDNQA